MMRLKRTKDDSGIPIRGLRIRMKMLRMTIIRAMMRLMMRLKMTKVRTKRAKKRLSVSMRLMGVKIILGLIREVNLGRYWHCRALTL